MIKNVVFDLGNVIAKGHSSSVLNELKISDEEKKYIKENFFTNDKRLDLGEISLEEYYNERNLNLKEDIKDRVLHYYIGREFDKDLIDIIVKLKKNNYKVYMLSNNNKDVDNYITSLPFFKENFDGFIFSCDYKLLKPHEEIYKLLLDKYNLRAEECIFVDDKLENVLASNNLGFKGFNYVVNPIKFNEFLKFNGVILDK